MESGGVRPNLAGLHHLGVSVTNLERSLRFYCDVVGADVLVEPNDAAALSSPAFVGRAAILSLGGRVFDLYEHSRNGGERFDPAHTGLDHLALEARSPEELQAWVAWVDGDLGLAVVQAWAICHVLLEDAPRRTPRGVFGAAGLGADRRYR